MIFEWSGSPLLKWYSVSYPRKMGFHVVPGKTTFPYMSALRVAGPLGAST